MTRHRETHEETTQRQRNNCRKDSTQADAYEVIILRINRKSEAKPENDEAGGQIENEVEEK